MLTRERVAALCATGASCRVDTQTPPRYRPGDRVLVKNIHPVGHTRLPRYVRGKRGVVARDHGVFVFPDTHAHGGGEKPQHVYSVQFAAREIWGATARAADSLRIDLWDDYLDPA